MMQLIELLDKYKNEVKEIEALLPGMGDKSRWQTTLGVYRTIISDLETITPSTGVVSEEEGRFHTKEEMERIIGEAFDAGERHEYEKHFGAVPATEPDKQQYIQSQLK